MEALFIAIVVAAAGVVGVGITYAFGRTEGIVRKYTSGRVESLLLKVNEFAEDVVLDFKENVVKDLKREGKWNKKVGEEIKKDAMDSLYRLINPAEVMEVLDITEGSVTEWLSSVIEKWVKKTKDETDAESTTKTATASKTSASAKKTTAKKPAARKTTTKKA